MRWLRAFVGCLVVLGLLTVFSATANARSFDFDFERPHHHGFDVDLDRDEDRWGFGGHDGSHGLKDLKLGFLDGFGFDRGDSLGEAHDWIARMKSGDHDGFGWIERWKGEHGDHGHHGDLGRIFELIEGDGHGGRHLARLVRELFGDDFDFDDSDRYCDWKDQPVVPEPGTALLMGAGLVALGLRRRQLR